MRKIMMTTLNKKSPTTIDEVDDDDGDDDGDDSL